MALKRKKSKSKQTKSKRATAKWARGKRAGKPKPPKKAVKKKQAKKTSSRTSKARKQKRQTADLRWLESSRSRQRAIPGEQSGDLQGLSRSEQADSESVDELVEEGNIIEAGVVAGVEEAENADEREVHTHEVPEDDVPDEYLENE